MSIEKTYNKTYKFLLLVPLVLLILSLGYIYVFYQENNDFIKKDVSLTGGTALTIEVNEQIDIQDLRTFLSQNLEDFSIREITGLTTGEQEAVVISSQVESDILKELIEDYLGYSLNSENSSIEFTGATLSAAFYSQLIKAILFAFFLMAIIVFLIFRSPIPSMAVILSAFADIVMTLAVVDLLGIKMSTAGIVAFLMIIGYSVDTDIMLTSRLLKQKEGELNDRLLSSLKTGLTMTLTSLVAVLVSLFITAGISEILKQIFLILAIGLGFDILNTWFGNAGILKWYIESKEAKNIK